MTFYYFDTSAIVKRYLVESGSAWVTEIVGGLGEGDSQGGFFLGEITRVEVAAAIAKRVFKIKDIDAETGERAYKLFLEHLDTEFVIVSLSPHLIREAADLARKHALRAYDAVQLSTALNTRLQLDEATDVLVFVTSDNNLLQAARAESLAVENPLTHAEPNAK